MGELAASANCKVAETDKNRWSTGSKLELNSKYILAYFYMYSGLSGIVKFFNRVTPLYLLCPFRSSIKLLFDCN